MSDQSLDTCSDEEFFATLETFVKFKVPLQIRNILTINSYNNAFAMSKLDETSIQEIEDFMRHNLKSNMIQNNDSLADYLGIFSNNQQEFKFLSGQKKILQGMSKHCQALYLQQVAESPETQIVSPVENQREHEDREMVMFQVLRQWICHQGALSEIFSQRLVYHIRQSSYITKSDGSVSCLMKCPVEQCLEGYTIVNKAYSSYFKYKRGTQQNKITSNVRPLSWKFASLQRHLLRSHSIYPNYINIDSSNDDDNGDERTSQILTKILIVVNILTTMRGQL